MRRNVIALALAGALVVVAAPLNAQSFTRDLTRDLKDILKDVKDVPKSLMPPPGMCRIWLDGVPPAQQPAPTDCASAVRNRPPNAKVIFSDQKGDPKDDKGKPKTEEEQRGDPRKRKPEGV